MFKTGIVLVWVLVLFTTASVIAQTGPGPRDSQGYGCWASGHFDACQLANQGDGHARLHGGVTRANDHIVASGALRTKHTFRGRGGDDIIVGGNHHDTLFGQLGADTLLGLGGKDQLFGGPGMDHLYGGLGNDYLNGGSQRDHLFGEAGNDWLVGGAGNDWLVGGLGYDFMGGGPGRDKYESARYMARGACDGKDCWQAITDGSRDVILADAEDDIFSQFDDVTQISVNDVTLPSIAIGGRTFTLSADALNAVAHRTSSADIVFRK